MEEIIKAILDKPLAFIITVGGILFLGLSGLTKVFKIEVDTANSKRLFIAGISLVIIGIPIYYYSQSQVSPELQAELIKVEFFREDVGHTCNQPYSLHVRETYEVDGAEGGKLTKVILNQDEVRTQDIQFQDTQGNVAINYCFKPGIERAFKVIIVANSGKASKVLEYVVNSMDESIIQDRAPELSRY